LGVTVAVAPVAPATGLPSGDIGVTTNSTTLSGGSVADVTLSNGAGSIAAELLPVGSYQLFANYAGDATFAPSRSSGLSVTITSASSISSLTASRKSVQPGQKVTFAVSVTGVTGGVSPTGTVIFTDSTNGAALGSASLSGNASSVISVASVLVISAQLQLGSNNITASYSGDNNYTPAVPTPLSIDLSGSFTTTISPGSLTLAANGTGTASVTVTATTGTVLTPGSITLACPTPTIAGVTCSFSPLTAGSTGTLTSTLTLNLASPLLAPPTHVATLKPAISDWLDAGLTGGFASLALLIMPSRRRRRSPVALSIIASCFLFFPLGCGSGGSNAPTLIATVTTLAVSPSSPILGAPVVFTAKVAPATGAGQPTGSVTFTSGPTTLGMASLGSGTATFTTSALPIGSQQAIATYSGDASYTGSASAASALDVAFSGTITITASDTIGDQSSASLVILVQ